MAYIATYLELYLRNTFQGKELHKTYLSKSSSK